MTDPTREDLVRAAEAAHQRSICNVPAGDLPVPLTEALDLRVAYNLEHGGGRDVLRIGHRAEGVANLEQPYLRRRGAGQAEPPKTTRRRRASKNTVKKTAAPATTKKES